jgi:hypothetical protein
MYCVGKMEGFFAFNLMTDKETNRPAGFNKIIMLSNVAELVQSSL